MYARQWGASLGRMLDLDTVAQTSRYGVPSPGYLRVCAGEGGVWAERGGSVGVSGGKAVGCTSTQGLTRHALARSRWADVKA